MWNRMGTLCYTYASVSSGPTAPTGMADECTDSAIALDALPREDVLTETERLLKGFANKTRLKILCILRDEEVCVHEIVEALDVSQSAVSHQLRMLRDARLVMGRREGRHVYYRLADTHVQEMLENALLHAKETG